MTLISQLSTEFRQLLDSTRDAMFIMDARGLVVALNPEAERLVGWTEAELLGEPMNRVLPGGFQYLSEPPDPSPKGDSGAAKRGDHGVLSARRKDGTEFAAEFNHNPLAPGDDALVLVTMWDLTLWLRNDDTSTRGKGQASDILASLGDALIVTDLNEMITFVNPRAERLTGWPSSEALGQQLETVLVLVYESTHKKVESVAARCLAAGHAVNMPDGVLLLHRDGSEVAIEDSAAPLSGRNGVTIGVVLAFHDVTERRRETRRLSHEATHDALTGLTSRKEFERRLTRVVESASDGSQHVLCYLDLDRFKPVNDTCGHEAGDYLLKTIGDLLASRLRTRDTVGRLGGDEFGILLEHCSMKQAKAIAGDMVSAVEDLRFEWGARSFSLSASIGLVAITAAHSLPADLLRAADRACYAAKYAGGNCVHVAQEPDAEAGRHLEIERVLG